MAMKETERSLRWYFLFAGVCGALSALKELSDANKIHSLLTAVQTFALYVPLVTRLVLGIGFVAAGVRIKQALLSGAGWIKKLLIFSGAMLFVDGALITAVFGPDVGQGGIIGAVVGLLITIYLYRSVVRLAAEAAERAGIAPPPPAAKVV